MNQIKNAADLLTALSEGFTDEELTFDTFQALIAAEISMKRQELGMSQKDLASLMGVSPSLVSRWEKGDANYTLETLCRIAAKLDIEMQSPFVIRKPAWDYTNLMDNITPISSSASWHSWISVSGTSGEYERLEAKEM